MRHREVHYIHPFVEALAFGLARAASFGAAGWLAKNSWFGINLDCIEHKSGDSPVFVWKTYN
jgi:hypothetical protein